MQAKHAAGEHTWGVDGETGKVKDHREGLMESAAVKTQTLKTAIESACLLLRVDECVRLSLSLPFPPSRAFVPLPPSPSLPLPGP